MELATRHEKKKVIGISGQLFFNFNTTVHRKPSYVVPFLIALELLIVVQFFKQ